MDCILYFTITTYLYNRPKLALMISFQPTVNRSIITIISIPINRRFKKVIIILRLAYCSSIFLFLS